MDCEIFAIPKGVVLWTERCAAEWEAVGLRTPKGTVIPTETATSLRGAVEWSVSPRQATELRGRCDTIGDTLHSSSFVPHFLVGRYDSIISDKATQVIFKRTPARGVPTGAEGDFEQM